MYSEFSFLVETARVIPPGRGGGVLLGILGGGVPHSSSNPDPIFHTRFQTRPLKSIPVFRPGF